MSECSSLTTFTEDTIFVTADTAKELIVTTYNRTVGTVVNVSCLDGFELVGPSTVQCMDSGLWWTSKPYCRVPVTTTPVPHFTDNMDEPLILIIVLAVVVVVVTAIIIVICLALYRGRFRYKENKQYTAYYDDHLSQPYSISEPQTADGHSININNMYPNPSKAHTNNQADISRRQDNHRHDNQRHYHQRLHREKMNTESNPQELIVTEPGHDVRVKDMGDHYYVATGYVGSRPEMRPPCPFCKQGEGHTAHSHSLSDIFGDTVSGRARDTGDTDRTGNHRDGYLWRSMHSLSDWTIPRPQFEA